jgi:hypothetical protein
LIDKNNKRENATHIPHTYQVGDLVVIKADENCKYDTRLPYATPRTVKKVYANGTVKLRQDTQRGGAVFKYGIYGTLNLTRPGHPCGGWYVA